ncbi:MAG: HAD family hydrolase [Chloroflexota bacterium]
MLTTVFFDLYGTLVRWAPDAEGIQAQAAGAEGITLGLAAAARAYPAANALLDEENAHAPLADRPQAERDAFFARYEQRLLEVAGAPVDLATASRVWARVSAAPKELVLYPDVLPALSALREAGLRVGVISNMGPQLDLLLAELGLLAHVGVWVSSAEAGVSKPHPAIFALGLRKAGAIPAQAAHVGDSPISDVEGARGAGLHPVLLLREAGLQAPVGCTTVASLPEVLPALRAAGLAG